MSSNQTTTNPFTVGLTDENDYLHRRHVFEQNAPSISKTHNQQRDHLLRRQKTTIGNGTQTVHLTFTSRRSTTPPGLDERCHASRLKQAFSLRNRRRHGCALLRRSRILLDARAQTEHLKIDQSWERAATFHDIARMLIVWGLSFASRVAFPNRPPFIPSGPTIDGHAYTSSLPRKQPLHPPTLRNVPRLQYTVLRIAM
jgi:hypothetical protein